MAKQVKDSEYWEEFGRRMGRKFGESNMHVKTYRFTGGSTIALLIFLIGSYWLAKDMGWIKPQVSIWAIIFLIVGFYWFVKSLFRRY